MIMEADNTQNQRESWPSGDPGLASVNPQLEA